MVDRGDGAALLQIPVGCSSVKRGCVLRLRGFKTIEQKTGEQAMVAIAAVFVVQRDQEQVGARQRVKLRLAVMTLTDIVAQ
ncbi:hypothetical protein D3C76_1793720 [compost metagenome]